MILHAINSHDKFRRMNVIEQAIRMAGGSTKLGRELGITRQAVEAWKTKGRVVPPEHVLAIEKLTGVSRYELRPDIYGSPPNPKKRAHHARAA
jgi:DNA-binding transcriptional regulator YdaS (Cro superfamily)